MNDLSISFTSRSFCKRGVDEKTMEGLGTRSVIWHHFTLGPFLFPLFGGCTPTTMALLDISFVIDSPHENDLLFEFGAVSGFSIMMPTYKIGDGFLIISDDLESSGRIVVLGVTRDDLMGVEIAVAAAAGSLPADDIDDGDTI